MPSEVKSKIYSTTHSRENSYHGIENKNIHLLETPSFKNQENHSGTATPRGSKDYLTTSMNLRKQKSMNMTDPSGNYFQMSR